MGSLLKFKSCDLSVLGAMRRPGAAFAILATNEGAAHGVACDGALVSQRVGAAEQYFYGVAVESAFELARLERTFERAGDSVVLLRDLESLVAGADVAGNVDCPSAGHVGRSLFGRRRWRCASGERGEKSNHGDGAENFDGAIPHLHHFLRERFGEIEHRGRAQSAQEVTIDWRTHSELQWREA